jgi:site-specific DNA-cytosine methylase
MVDYTALFLFCGLGSGAHGFLEARTKLFGREARFRSVGGIDNDPDACLDFEYLTNSPALCADVATLTTAELRRFAGPRAPDAAFGSAPCKSFSGLTSPLVAASDAYVDMARLYVTGVELLLSTWDVPPRLIILENVPRILSSGAHLVAEVMAMLEAAGYSVDISTHDCGEIGGLAQRRRRALLVGRLKRSVIAPLMRPRLLPVKSCGSVLGELPMPEDPRAGPLHKLPRIGWLTWMRLAMIPAGGDYRDLPGALDGLNARREAWCRHHVEAWNSPSVAVTSSGTNGSYGVADPRVAAPTSSQFQNNHAVGEWDAPARTVIGATRPGSGAASVADPRAARWFPGTLGVVPWTEPLGTVTGGASPTRGAFAVADVRFGERAGRNADHCYGVLPWTSPSFTVHGTVHPGTGAYTVADPRVQLHRDTPGNEGDRVVSTHESNAFGSTGFSTISLDEATKTISPEGTIGGPFAIVDSAHAPVAFIDKAKDSPFVIVETTRAAKRAPFFKTTSKRVDVPVIILAADGTWHRPLTPLELARLQDLPAMVNGLPLQLAGSSISAIVERIGNAVPSGAARGIAEQMLLCLVSSDVGAGMLPVGGKVWVSPWLANNTQHAMVVGA